MTIQLKRNGGGDYTAADHRSEQLLLHLEPSGIVEPIMLEVLELLAKAHGWQLVVVYP